MKTIDINCDVGEGYAIESNLMPLISSCNIACGGHTGDATSIATSLQNALQHKVKIGAHPSFPDKKHFGRKEMNISNTILQKNIEHQLHMFKEIAQQQNAAIHHVKAHGALYNVAAQNKEVATTLLKAIKNTIGTCMVYAPYGSVLEEIAATFGIETKREAFIDRNYHHDLSLVARSLPNATITVPEKAFQHLYQMITSQTLTTISGEISPIKATTFCIHGDHQDSLEIITYLHKELAKKGIEIE